MAKRLPLPPRDLVVSLLDYNPETGIFKWKVSRGRKAKKGDIAGSLRHFGHRAIKICGTGYYASRLAWLIMTGEDPHLDPDHKNGMYDDNRWENLRLATFTQNKANSRTYKNNKSGYKGVSWNKREQKWVAQVCIDKKPKHLGYFEDPEEAYAVYKKAAKETFGEFARLR